jgi:hypothetical protein
LPEILLHSRVPGSDGEEHNAKNVLLTGGQESKNSAPSSGFSDIRQNLKIAAKAPAPLAVPATELFDMI